MVPGFSLGGKAKAESGVQSRARSGGRNMKWIITILGIVFCSLRIARASEPAASGMAFFESKVRPLLIDHCYDCHSGDNTKGGLSLETKAAWSKGGDSGPAIVPGNPDESLVIQAVRYTDADLAMPPQKKGGKLSPDKIAVLEEWVKMGAPDPRETVAKIAGMAAAEAKGWWAFQPFPAATITSAGIDAAIDARLASTGLPAAALADKRTLIRRAGFDLTGLPPSPEDVAAFAADTAPDAFGKVVERLLASPHYGEKWGRHWLDTVRFADALDSRTYNQDGDILDSWRYRDWVVNAFNRDLPYDQFVTQQLAGDVLAARGWDAQKVVATGLYAIGNWGNGDADKEKVHTDMVDDQIDVTGRAFLGLTLACARCHDHKFDPLTTKDYYAMAGIFFSSRILENFASKGAGEKLMRIPLDSPAQSAEREWMRKRIAEIDDHVSSQLLPFTEVTRDASGKAGLISWKGRGADNPSLSINSTDAPVAFTTINLPGRTVALHPGPKVPASAVWRSPVTGTVRVSGRLADADPNGGDGIVWTVRHGGKVLRTAEMNNAMTADIEKISVPVAAGDLISLSIGPRAEYTFDTTQIEFVIHDEQGAKWDLREALTSGAAQGFNDLWWLCSGAGPQLVKNDGGDTELATERQQLDEKLTKTDYAQGLREGGIPQTRYAGYHDAEVHKRGSYATLGDLVPRGFPSLLTKEQPVIREGSGRLELASWIASAENPLTARVMVNRIWQHHFGEGLVRTPNNFGKLGTLPTHPELLDALAAEFIRSGWSMKHMHRLIMGSAAYQRSASPVGQAGQLDAENKLLSHQHRRRLTAEELRDAMLYVAGRLDLSLGGKSSPDLLAPRRTLYLTTIRSDRTGFQTLFDGADPTAIVEKRTEATVAPQSLFLLNHPFTLAQAAALSDAAAKAVPDPKERIRWLWECVFQRQPTPADLALANHALGEAPDAGRWTAFCQMLFCSNEFTYVD